jgi:hypothetical protein
MSEHLRVGLFAKAETLVGCEPPNLASRVLLKDLDFEVKWNSEG